MYYLFDWGVRCLPTLCEHTDWPLRAVLGQTIQWKCVSARLPKFRLLELDSDHLARFSWNATQGAILYLVRMANMQAASTVLSRIRNKSPCTVGSRCYDYCYSFERREFNLIAPLFKTSFGKSLFMCHFRLYVIRSSVELTVSVSRV